MIPILKKCLEELTKESPKLDYVRGMLETIIEIQNPSKEETAIPIVDASTKGTKYTYSTPVPQDEATILDEHTRLVMKELQLTENLE